MMEEFVGPNGFRELRMGGSAVRPPAFPLPEFPVKAGGCALYRAFERSLRRQFGWQHGVSSSHMYGREACFFIKNYSFKGDIFPCWTSNFSEKIPKS